MSKTDTGGPAFPHPVIDPRGLTPLTTLEQSVVERRDAGMTLKDLAAELKITRERVRQIEARAKYKRQAVIKIVPGMTLLDWFAGLNCAAIMLAAQRDQDLRESIEADAESRGIKGTNSIALLAYEQAEAMLAEKRRREGESQ